MTSTRRPLSTLDDNCIPIRDGLSKVAEEAEVSERQRMRDLFSSDDTDISDSGKSGEIALQFLNNAQFWRLR